MLLELANVIFKAITAVLLHGSIKIIPNNLFSVKTHKLKQYL